MVGMINLLIATQKLSCYKINVDTCVSSAKIEKKSSYIKHGSCMEVSCPMSSSYEELCEICAEALEIDCDDTHLFELRLFRIDGTVVPNQTYR